MGTMIEYPCERCGVTVRRERGREGRGRYCSIRCATLNQPRPSREERYRAKVVTGPGCWDWSGHKNANGYGVMYSGPRGSVHQELAHRVSWEIHEGPVPTGLWVLHRCDNPPCSNPEHLYVGLPADNVRDRDSRGRANTLRGEAIGTAKVTADQVLAIRRRRTDGALLREIAAEFGLSVPTVDQIVTRRSWKHI